MNIAMRTSKAMRKEDNMTPRLTRVGETHTVVYTDHDGLITVRYHKTPVVRFNGYVIHLDTGGHFTATTKLRMNQASHQYALEYRVYSEGEAWYCKHKQHTMQFDQSGKLSFDRYSRPAPMPM